MADNQEPDVARRLGGGANRSGVSGSAEAVGEKLKNAFKQIADYADKAHKRLSDMEKIAERIDKRTRASQAFGGQGAGNRISGSPNFGGAGGGGGGFLGALGAGRGQAAGQAGGSNLLNPPGGQQGGGNSLLGGATNMLGQSSPMGAAAAAGFRVAGAYGRAHLGDAATMELLSARLADAGGPGSSQERWRAGMGIARVGGYSLQDNAQALSVMSNMGLTTDDPRFQQLKGQVRDTTREVPGASATDAAGLAQTLHSTQSIFGGRTIGIRTTGQGGQPLSRRDVAEQILGQYRGSSRRGTVQYSREIAAAMDQGGGISQREDVLNVTGAQRDILNRTIQDLAAGRDPSREADRAPLDEQTKETAQSQLETTSETAQGIAEGAATIKEAAETFRDAANALLRGTHAGGLAGGLAGAASQVGGPDHSAMSQQGGPATGWQGIENAVRKLGFQFGTPTPGQTTARGYGAHGAGLAVDFGDATSDSAAIAKALVPYATGPNAAIQQLIFSPLNIGYDSGVNKGEKFFGADTWAAHRNHVHVAVKPGVDLAAVVAAGPGAQASSSDGSGTDTQASNASGATSTGIVNSAGALIAEGQTAAILGAGGLAGGGGGGGGSSSSSKSSDSTDGGSSGGTAPAATGPLQDYAKKLLAQHGWGDQWENFNKLEMQEAGWNVSATNKSSGAYGLAQALPPSKYASAGADWKTSGYTQLRWMMDYIADRYGDVNKAWQHEVSNNWYQKGAWEIDRDQYARVHAGEMVVPADQAEQVRQSSTGGGPRGPVTINVSVQSASESEVLRLVQRIKTELDRDSVIEKIGAA